MSTMQAQVTLLGIKDLDCRKIFLWTPGWDKWESVQEFLKSKQTFFDLAPPPVPEHSITRSIIRTVLGIGDEKTAVLNDDSTVAIEGVHAAPIPRSESPFTEVLEENTASQIRRLGGVQSDFWANDFSIENVDPEASNKFQLNMTKAKTSPPQKANQRIGERHQFKIEVILVSKSGRSFRTYSENISIGGTLLCDDLPKDFLGQPFDLVLVNKFERNPDYARLRFPGRVVGDYANPRRLMFGETDVQTRTRLENLIKAYISKQQEFQKKSG